MFDAYRAQVGPVIEQFGRRYLVCGGGVHTLEDDLGLKLLSYGILA